MMVGLSGPLDDLGLPNADTWTPTESGGFWSGGGADWLNTLTRGTLAIVGSQVQRPTYETHTTPGGSSTVIRTGGAFNYPGGGAGPTQVPVAGVSVTTMLLLGVAAMALLMMAKR
jgi:hypothetical protein